MTNVEGKGEIENAAHIIYHHALGGSSLLLIIIGAGASQSIERIQLGVSPMRYTASSCLSASNTDWLCVGSPDVSWPTLGLHRVALEICFDPFRSPT